MEKIYIDSAEINLPRVEYFNLRNSTERYGFTYLLSEKIKQKSPKRCFRINWQHGIYSHAEEETKRVYCRYLDGKSDHELIISGTNRDAKRLKIMGVSNVIAAGLPFAYTKPSGQIKRKALLAFPAHSSEAKNERIKLESDYIDYLSELKSSFEKIFVSAYSLDSDANFFKAARKAGLTVIQGSVPNDKNSLKRLRMILDVCSHVTTNTVGSHLFYAASNDCITSVCGPLYNYEKSKSGKIYLTKANISDLKEAYTFGKQFNLSDINSFFTRCPLEGARNKEFGDLAIGRDAVLENKDMLISILKWSKSDQTKEYIRAGIRMTSRIIKNLRSNL